MHCYPPLGEESGKRAQVEEMFSALAPRYDLLNRVLSFGVDRRWRSAAVDALECGPVQRVLDVATGTGDLGLAVLQRQPSTVVGVDISEQMLEIARAKAVRARVSDRIVFERGAAEELPFEGAAFDVAMVAFGVRNFQDLDRALAELFRVLRPGGRLIILEFSQPQSRVFGALYRTYGRFVLPLVGRLLSRVRGAYTYLPDSIRVFPHGEAFILRMRAAGFTALRSRPLTFGVASLYVGHTPSAQHGVTDDT